MLAPQLLSCSAVILAFIMVAPEIVAAAPGQTDWADVVLESGTSEKQLTEDFVDVVINCV